MMCAHKTMKTDVYRDTYKRMQNIHIYIFSCMCRHIYLHLLCYYPMMHLIWIYQTLNTDSLVQHSYASFFIFSFSNFHSFQVKIASVKQIIASALQCQTVCLRLRQCLKLRWERKFSLSFSVSSNLSSHPLCWCPKSYSPYCLFFSTVFLHLVTILVLLFPTILHHQSQL